MDHNVIYDILTGEIIKHGDIRSITGEGMPTYRSPFNKGQLIIKFSVKFPEDGFFTPDAIKVSVKSFQVF